MMIDSIIRTKWKGKEGLNRALDSLKTYFEYNGRIPKTRDVPSIYSALKRGSWKEVGINNWEELLMQAEFPILRKGHSLRINWVGENGLKFARELAIVFNREEHRSPRTKDLTTVYSAIYSKYWVNYGIDTWNDFLQYCGLPQNRGNKWYGRTGLQLAIQTYQDFRKTHNQKPSIIDLKVIFSRINEGMWEEFDITTWNDFVQRSSQDIQYRKGETGLKLHISELEF